MSKLVEIPRGVGAIAVDDVSTVKLRLREQFGDGMFIAPGFVVSAKNGTIFSCDCLDDDEARAMMGDFLKEVKAAQASKMVWHGDGKPPKPLRLD